MSCSSCCCVLMSACRMRVLSSSCSFSWFMTPSCGCCSWYMEDCCCCCCCCGCCCWIERAGEKGRKNTFVLFQGNGQMWLQSSSVSHVMVYSCYGGKYTNLPTFCAILILQFKCNTDEWFLGEIHNNFFLLNRAQPAGEINTSSSDSKTYIQTESQKATGWRGSLNTNHCGVLAAGRRKGEAHWGNKVKGILSLCQILQGEKMGKVILCNTI